MALNEATVLYNLNKISNALSLVGCVFVIINYQLIYRRFLINASESIKAHHISLLLLSINNVFLHAGGLAYSLLDWKGTRVICVLQGLHITFFNLANFLWGVCICLNVYLILLPPEKLRSVRRNIIYKFIGFSFGIPLILMIPLYTRLECIVNIGPWCWIKANDLRWGIFYGWLLAAFFMYLFLLSMVLVLLLRIWNTSDHADRKTHHPYEKMVGRYVLYVIAFFLCWGPGVVGRVMELSNPAFYNFPLMAIHTFLSVSLSFWLSLIWGFTTSLPEVYQIIWNYGWSKVTPIQQFGSWSSAFTGLKGLDIPPSSTNL